MGRERVVSGDRLVAFSILANDMVGSTVSLRHGQDPQPEHLSKETKSLTFLRLIFMT